MTQGSESPLITGKYSVIGFYMLNILFRSFPIFFTTPPTAISISLRKTNQIAVVSFTNPHNDYLPQLPPMYATVDRDSVDLVLSVYQYMGCPFFSLKLKSRTPDGIQLQLVGGEPKSFPEVTLMQFSSPEAKKRAVELILRTPV